MDNEMWDMLIDKQNKLKSKMIDEIGKIWGVQFVFEGKEALNLKVFSRNLDTLVERFEDAGEFISVGSKMEKVLINKEKLLYLSIYKTGESIR
jgi:hypothetical protein